MARAERQNPILGRIINPILQAGRTPQELIDGTESLVGGRFFNGVYIETSDHSGLVKYSRWRRKFVVPIATKLGILGKPRKAAEWVRDANLAIRGRR